MSVGLQIVNAGLAVAGFAGIFWWMRSLSARSRAQRRLALSTQAIARQPWADDRPDGRGNR